VVVDKPIDANGAYYVGSYPACKCLVDGDDSSSEKTK